VVYFLYLWQAICPRNLSIFYPYPQAGIPIGQAVGAFVALCVLTAFVIIGAKRFPYLAVGWFWYVGTLVPVIGIVQIGRQRMADRYMYIPLIGLSIGLTWLVCDLARRARRTPKFVLRATVATLVVALAILSHWQVDYWQNSMTLFERNIAVTSNNPVGHHNLGEAWLDADRVDEAATEFRKAIEIDPYFVPSWNNLGTILARQGKLEESMTRFRRALEIDPNYMRAHFNLGNALAAVGKRAEAEAHYREALSLNPHSTDVLNNLGNLMLSLNRVDEAVELFLRALNVDPGNSTAFTNLGVAYHRQGRGREALEAFQQAVAVSSKSVNAHFNLAAAYLQAKQWRLAAMEFETVLLLDPGHKIARKQLTALRRNFRRPAPGMRPPMP
jgi:Tfp pilus assembly protein PilF